MSIPSHHTIHVDTSLTCLIPDPKEIQKLREAFNPGHLRGGVIALTVQTWNKILLNRSQELLDSHFIGNRRTETIIDAHPCKNSCLWDSPRFYAPHHLGLWRGAYAWVSPLCCLPSSYETSQVSTLCFKLVGWIFISLQITVFQVPPFSLQQRRLLFCTVSCYHDHAKSQIS